MTLEGIHTGWNPSFRYSEEAIPETALVFVPFQNTSNSAIGSRERNLLCPIELFSVVGAYSRVIKVGIDQE